MHLLHEWPVPFLLALVTSLQLRSGCAVTVAMYVGAYSVKLVFLVAPVPKGVGLYTSPRKAPGRKRACSPGPGALACDFRALGLTALRALNS